jgi:acyl carrier protein
LNTGGTGCERPNIAHVHGAIAARRARACGYHSGRVRVPARRRGAAARGAGRGARATLEREGMDVAAEVAKILDEVLRLGDRARQLDAATPLLGAIPELDSMAVVAVLTAFEERLGMTVEDDEVDGAAFATFGALCEFARAKLGG